MNNVTVIGWQPIIKSIYVKFQIRNLNDDSEFYTFPTRHEATPMFTTLRKLYPNKKLRLVKIIESVELESE